MPARLPGAAFEYVNATNGITAAGIKAGIDASLASYNDRPLQFVLVNLGANEVLAMPAQADFESDLGYIFDSVHAKWPAARVLAMRIWSRLAPANSATIDVWIGNVVAARPSFSGLGPDERVFLENGDNGITYTTDGVHPSPGGYDLTAQQWKAAMGY